MRRRQLVYIEPGGPIGFPDPRGAGKDGLVAVGGDLSAPRLLAAYTLGIFPWYDDEHPPLWWSPDPRAVIDADHLHVSRSLARRLRKQEYTVTLDRDFRGVIQGCAQGRSDGTWLLPEMIDAYTKLHQLGHAHSVEVWLDGALAGGLYGVRVGGLFAAESMFHTQTDASKLALVHAVRGLFGAGVRLFDVQFLTAHLSSLGAYEIPRDEYLRRVEDARGASVDLRRVKLGATD
jgi:leucyl/phenylalanyl-tRNA--protein transferase